MGRLGLVNGKPEKEMMDDGGDWVKVDSTMRSGVPALSPCRRRCRKCDMLPYAVCVLQANLRAASGALATDAATLHPAVARSLSDARLHDVQRLSLSGGHARRHNRILLFRVDSTFRTSLRHRHMPLRTCVTPGLYTRSSAQRQPIHHISENVTR